MTTKELIQSEIDRISDEDLDELYSLVKDFTQSKQQGRKQSLMSKLRAIQINAPEDFSTNL
ncbi:MAG: hypothetical protein ACJ74J_21960 [Blastocatellia bacterium]